MGLETLKLPVTNSLPHENNCVTRCGTWEPVKKHLRRKRAALVEVPQPTPGSARITYKKTFFGDWDALTLSII